MFSETIFIDFMGKKHEKWVISQFQIFQKIFTFTAVVLPNANLLPQT